MIYSCYSIAVCKTIKVTTKASRAKEKARIDESGHVVPQALSRVDQEVVDL